MTELRDETELTEDPSLMKDTAMSWIIADIFSMAFMGFGRFFSFVLEFADKTCK